MQLKGAFKMKKFVSLLLTLMMALGMTALAEESKDQLARIQEKGEIVIATEGTWAPWTYTDENGNLVGFDVEIATAIAEKLGVKAKAWSLKTVMKRSWPFAMAMFTCIPVSELRPIAWTNHGQKRNNTRFS